MTSYLATKNDLILSMGWIAVIGVGLAVALILALILALLQWANQQYQLAELQKMQSQKPSQINPLATSFEDKIIRVEDLYLPGFMVHDKKNFNRCKFVGPGSLALIGGQVQNVGFLDSGNVVPVASNIAINGVPFLQNCTITNCEFYRITILSNPEQAKEFNKLIGFQAGHDNANTQTSPS